MNAYNGTDEPCDVRVTLMVRLEPGESVADKIKLAITRNWHASHLRSDAQQVQAVFDILGITEETPS